MLPISDILIRSIKWVCVYNSSSYIVFCVKKSGQQSIFEYYRCVCVCYYLFGILTVTGIGYTSTISFRPQISIIPFGV